MSNVKQRFSFPGFTTIAQSDTAKVLVEVGELKFSGVTFTVTLVKNRHLPSWANFTVASVAVNGKEVWQFKKNRPDNFHGIAQLMLADDEPVIGFVEAGKNGKLVEVVPFITFTGQAVSGVDTLRLKRAAADKLGLGYKVSVTEEIAMELAQEKAAKEKATKKDEREEKRRERHQRLMSRPEVKAWTATGVRRRGIPVTKEEWPSLGGKYVILVSFYDDETGECGEPLEAFRVKKVAGRHPQKDGAVAVFADNPTKRRGAKGAAPEVAKPETVITILDDDQPFPVYVFADKGALSAAREDGSWIGKLVSWSEQVSETEATVYRVPAEGGLRTVGKRSVYRLQKVS